MTVLRHVRAASCASLLVVALAGCGGDPEPEFSPAPSASPTASASAEVDEPEAWEEKSDDGAVAFVEHWIDEFSIAFQTGETSDVEALATPNCGACAGLTALIDDAYRGGGSIEGEAWTLADARTSGTPPDGQAAVSADIDQPAQVVRVPGESAARTAPGQVTYLFELTWDGGWLVSGILFEE